MSTEPDPPVHTLPLPIRAVRSLLDHHFPGLLGGERGIHIESVAMRAARCRLTPGPGHIRPGGTVSGPALFELADVAIYVALIGSLGAPAIAAVTSNLNINFLARPAPVDIVADVSLLRIGRRLAFAEARLVCAGQSELVALATGSYALTSRV